MKLLRYYQRCNKMAACVCFLVQAIYFIGGFIMVQGTTNFYANIGDNITATCQIEKVHVWTFLKTKEILAFCREKNEINMKSTKAKRLNIGANCSLQIYKFKKEDVGKYKCSHPIQINKSDIIHIQLRIQPNVSLRVYINSVQRTKKQTVTVKEGDTFELICNEQSNGTIGTFRWTHNLQNLPNSTNKLLFEKVERQMNGKYVCTAENLAGDEDSDTVNVSVEYPPLVENKSHIFSIGDKPRILKCEVSGVPNRYQFSTWRHLINGHHVRFLVGQENGTLTLPYNNTSDIQYDDSGLYICNVTNNILNENGQLWQTGIVNVIIKDKPVLAKPLKHVYTVQNISSTSVTLCLLSSSELSASYVLNERNERVKTTQCAASTVNTNFHGTLVNVSGYVCNFSITDIEGENFQNYSVRVSNDCCYDTFNFSIRFTREPVKPNVLEFTSSTTCIYVLMEPGSDGGMHQDIIIEYRKQRNQKWKWLLVKHVKTSRVSYYIPSLDPSTAYEVRIFARNAIGSSSSTETYSVWTKDEKKSVWIIVIIVATVLTVCVIIICWRRRKAEKDVSHRSQIIELSNQGGAIENSLYQSASDLTEPPTASGNVETVNDSIERNTPHVNRQIVGYNIGGKEERTRPLDCEELKYREERNIRYDSSTLNYVEVVFDPAEAKSKFHIHGAENRTPYTDIDFSQTADPMTSSDEESIPSQEDNNDFVSLEDVQQWNIHEN